MKHFKPNMIEFALAFLIIPFNLIVISITILVLVYLICGGNNGNFLIPWQVYLIVGIISLLLILTYITIYIFYQYKIVITDNKIIGYNKKNIEWGIEKSKIDRIEFVKSSLLLGWLHYERYGLITIYCNKENNYEKKTFKVFRHTIKDFQNLGYKVVII